MRITIIITLFCWCILSGTSGHCQSAQAKPLVIGIVEEIYSKELAEVRKLNIYLPEGYNANDSVRYPVIYVLDGSVNEDFIHIAGLVQYYNFEWINSVPKSIVVGITTVDRRRDFTFPTTIQSDRKKFATSGGSSKFMTFIVDELKPFINKNYQTTSSATLIGQSLGGLLAAEILFKTPEMFSNYLIISPSLWWDNGSLLSSQPSENSFVKVYIAVGKEGATPTEIPRLMEEDAEALANKLRRSHLRAVIFDFFPDEDHSSIMHLAVMRGLNKVFAK